MLFFNGYHHWRRAFQLETFGRKYSKTFQCVGIDCFSPNTSIFLCPATVGSCSTVDILTPSRSWLDCLANVRKHPQCFCSILKVCVVEKSTTCQPKSTKINLSWWTGLWSTTSSSPYKSTIYTISQERSTWSYKVPQFFFRLAWQRRHH